MQVRLLLKSGAVFREIEMVESSLTPVIVYPVMEAISIPGWPPLPDAVIRNVVFEFRDLSAGLQAGVNYIPKPIAVYVER